MSAKRLPASLAASIRLGATSVATMDSDTSIDNITTARLRGIRTSWVGAAIAVVNNARDATNSAAGRWRHRVFVRSGATCSSNSMFANRMTRLRLRNNATTYNPTSPRMTRTKRKNHEWANPDNVSGPSSGTVMSAHL
jgi:hypothetical protein